MSLVELRNKINNFNEKNNVTNYLYFEINRDKGYPEIKFFLNQDVLIGVNRTKDIEIIQITPIRDLLTHIILAYHSYITAYLKDMNYNNIKVWFENICYCYMTPYEFLINMYHSDGTFIKNFKIK